MVQQKVFNKRRQKWRNRGTKNISGMKKTNSKIDDINLTFSTILNVNELNTPIKRQVLTGQIEKQDPSICCL